MNTSSKIIGIDIGGTKIRSLLYSDGRIKLVKQYKTPKLRKEFVILLNKIIKSYTAAHRIKGVGIGIAGKVEGKIVISCANIPYIKNLNLAKVIIVQNIKVDNDARCFARAEYLYGAGRGSRNILFFTIGTGVGRAYGFNNKISKINKFELPEVWEKKYQQIRDHKTLNELVVYLTSKLALLIKQYQPQAVVIGGGVIKAQHGQLFSKIKHKLLADSATSNIQRTRLKDNAAALGAALLFAK
ncbi:MAG: ROK family protein [Patescibacteria group bacterium]